MTEDFLKQLLQPLRRIEPEQTFIAASKARILLATQEPPMNMLSSRLRIRFFESLTLTGAIALASFLILIAFGSISYLSGGGATLATSFNNDALISEAQSTDFQLQIKAVTYFDESAKQVAMALDKITQPNAQDPKK